MNEIESLQQVVLSVRTDQSNQESKRKAKDSYLREVKAYKKSIEQTAIRSGLNNDEIKAMISVVLTKGSLDDNVRGELFNVLIPNEFISGDIINKMISSVSSESTCIRMHIFKWLSCVLGHLQNDAKESLHRLYGVIFMFLDFEFIRPFVCKILYLYTTRKVVTNFRVSALKNVLQRCISSAQDGTDVFFLLQLFSQYNKDIILPNWNKSRRKTTPLFNCPDKQFLLRLNLVQLSQLENNYEHLMPKSEERDLGVQFLLRLQRDGVSKKNLYKKKETSSIPSISTSAKGDDILTLEQLSNPRELATALLSSMQDKGKEKKIALPDKLLSSLRDRVLQHLLVLEPIPQHLYRIRFALPLLLEEEIYGNNKNTDCNQRQLELFDSLVSFCDFLQEMPPELETFIIQYLKIWDHTKFNNQIFSLLSRLRPRSYESLYSQILKPLHQSFIMAPPSFKAQVLDCFSRMLHNWACLDWFTHYNKSNEGVELNTNDGSYIFEKIPDTVDHYRTIYEFVHFVDQICLVGLASEKDNILVQNGCLSFFECVCTLNTTHSFPFVIPPSPSLTYRLLLSSTAMGVSRICGIMVLYKAAFESLKKNETKGWYSMLSFRSGLDKISLFNSFIWDFSNTLWRNQPLPILNGTEKEGKVKAISMLFNLPQNVLDELAMVPKNIVDHSLSITHSSTFSSYAYNFLKEKKGVRDLGLLRGSLKAEYVNYLKNNGLFGLHDFLYSFISSLLQRKNKQEQK